MGNTWIVDLQHYLTPTGAMAPVPSRARLLAEYFASIVVDATTNLDDPPTLRCRRRPGHRNRPAKAQRLLAVWRVDRSLLEIVVGSKLFSH
jgi:hypothetical protein